MTALGYGLPAGGKSSLAYLLSAGRLPRNLRMLRDISRDASDTPDYNNSSRRLFRARLCRLCLKQDVPSTELSC